MNNTMMTEGSWDVRKHRRTKELMDGATFLAITQHHRPHLVGTRCPINNVM